MNIWLRLSATFHEHPKMLAVRAAAGSRADSAELGWYRLLMAAKRYGRWSFASEEHLAHVAGTYYRFVPLYRSARLLDDLTVHDGDSYNAIKTDAERKAEQRERDKSSREGVTGERDVARDQVVTLDNRHTNGQRVQTDKDASDVTPDDGREDLEAFLLVTRRAPSVKQRELLDRIVDSRDESGPHWAAAVILSNPDDPIGAVIEADKAWRSERIEAAKVAEAKPRPMRRKSGLPEHSRELLEHWAAQEREKLGVDVTDKRGVAP